MNNLVTGISDPMRIALILAIVVGAHLLVIVARRLSRRVLTALPRRSYAKIRSIVTLLTSIVIFTLYFAAIGFVLRELGISLTAYLASASVVGLAVGFGSQGLVQDVVTGLTLIFSDLLDVDDMVEVSGQIGVVKSIGMRFVVLKNYFGAEVFIPNRTINTVVNYKRGYIRCLVDVTLAPDHQLADQMEAKVKKIVQAAFEQYSGIFITEPSSEGRIKTLAGKEFLRIKFRIWPGRGKILETALHAEIVQSLKRMVSDYADWMVTVDYEVEKKSIILTA